ncbi:hypothetical protein CLF_105185 [Clonorchis sinensis]|uniref:Uncharacterized protein n=1 Tax=Clonorchis sinensis TaxID=79923 RepID=G7YD53_CLOSI|nr:hypothetical protein CLF_105185 [Clonorchis sinensis]
MKLSTIKLLQRIGGMKILERTVSIQKAYPTIRRISEDRPLEAQQLGHSSFRMEAISALWRVGSNGSFALVLAKVVQQSAWTQHVAAPTRYRAGQLLSLLKLIITNNFADHVKIDASLGHSDHCERQSLSDKNKTDPGYSSESLDPVYQSMNP